MPQKVRYRYVIQRRAGTMTAARYRATLLLHLIRNPFQVDSPKTEAAKLARRCAKAIRAAAQGTSSAAKVGIHSPSQRQNLTRPLLSSVASNKTTSGLAANMPLRIKDWSS